MKCPKCKAPMKWTLGRKLSTDPHCRQGRRIRHASPCACTYQKLDYCPACGTKKVDGEIAPRLLSDVFPVV